MILPTKHISIRYSLLGVGTLLLKRLERPHTVTALWEKVRQTREIGTFERFTLTLDFLYAIGAIQFDGDLLWRITFNAHSSDMKGTLYPEVSERFEMDEQLALVFEKQQELGGKQE